MDLRDHLVLFKLGVGTKLLKCHQVQPLSIYEVNITKTIHTPTWIYGTFVRWQTMALFKHLSDCNHIKIQNFVLGQFSGLFPSLWIYLCALARWGLHSLYQKLLPGGSKFLL